MTSRPKFSCGIARVLVRPSSQINIAVSFAISTSSVWKLPSALSRSISICPRTPPGSSLGLAAMYRVASAGLVAPASFVYAVAKWLCQKSVIFSCSGRLVCTIRNSHRCCASVMTVFGENTRPRRRDLHVARLRDLGIDVVDDPLVVDQRLHCFGEGHPAVDIQLVGPGAESRAPQQVLEVLVVDECHQAVPAASALGRISVRRRSHRSRPARSGACGKDPAPQRSIRRPADREIQDQAGDRRCTLRAGDDARNPAAIGEQIPLDQDGIPELRANFVIDGAAIAPRQPPDAVADRLDDASRGVLAGNHRVVDPLGGKPVDEPSRVARQDHAAASRLS